MWHSHFTNDGPIIPTMQTRNCKKQGPAVQNMVERWPALFTERQVFAEFNRIASKNLEGDLRLWTSMPHVSSNFSKQKGNCWPETQGGDAAHELADTRL